MVARAMLLLEVAALLEVARALGPEGRHSPSRRCKPPVAKLRSVIRDRPGGPTQSRREESLCAPPCPISVISESVVIPSRCQRPTGAGCHKPSGSSHWLRPCRPMDLCHETGGLRHRLGLCRPSGPNHGPFYRHDRFRGARRGLRKEVVGPGFAIQLPAPTVFAPAMRFFSETSTAFRKTRRPADRLLGARRSRVPRLQFCETRCS